MAEINKNKFLGEAGLARLVQNIEDNFSHIDHIHTAEEVGADTAGSAAAALTLGKQYTDEQIATITAGDVVVKESEHSSTADKATSADEATKATQDANGNVITDTYETKIDASAKLDEAKAYTDEQINILIPSEMDALMLVSEVGFVEPAQNNGSILTDNNGAIYTI